MKVTVEDISPIQKRLSVEIPADEVASEIENAYRRLNHQVTVQGFRKGKAPRSVLERQYRQHVEGEVLEKLIETTLPKALEEADATLILQPELDSASPLKTNEAFTYSALLDLWPEFDLPEYKGLELEEQPVSVTDDEVDQQLDALRAHFATLETVEEARPVQDKDIVILDYVAEIDGEPVDSLKEENYYLEVGAGHFNEQFEEQLKGAEKGIERAVEVDYPEDAVNAKVAGKKVTYRVTVKDIKRRVLPELNDDFARKLGAQFQTVEDVKNRLRTQIERDKQEAAQGSLRQQLLHQLTEKTDFAVPDRLVEQKLTQMVDNVISHLSERGTDLERAGMSEERLRERMRDDAVFQVKTEIILDKIADKENISVANEELAPYLNTTRSQAKLDPAQVDAVVRQHILPKLRTQKTLDFLLEQAQKTAAAPSPEGQ